MVENAARAIRNRAEQPIDMAEARYLARAALDASGIGEMVEALEKIRAGSKLGIEMFEARVRERKDRLTWWAVNVLQDHLAACEGTADAALSRARATVGNKDE
jgi:hypothetical protein